MLSKLLYISGCRVLLSVNTGSPQMHVIQGNQIWAKRIEIWHCCYIIPAVAQSCCMEAFDSFLCIEIRIRLEISLLWMSISAYFLLVLSVFSLTEWQLTADGEKTLTDTLGRTPAPPCVVTLGAAVDIKHQVCEEWRPRCLWQINVICDGDMGRARGIPVTIFRANFSMDWKVCLLVGSRKNREQNRVMTDLSI